MEVRLITDWASFHALGAEWDELASAADHTHIFMTFAWMKAWALTVPEDIDPFVLTVHSDDGVLDGLLPLWVSKMMLLEVFPLRALRFMGDTCTASEYAAVLARSGKEEIVHEKIADALKGYGAQWDVAWFPNCLSKPDIPSLTSVAENFVHKHRPRDFSSFDLSPSWSDYETLIGASARQRNRRLIRQFDDLGGEFEDCDHPDKVAEFLQSLFKLHADRWNSIGEPGSFKKQPAAARFYEHFVPEAYAEGWLTMTGYRLEGELKAVQFGFLFKGTYLQIQEGFDPEQPSGLGNALRYYSIRRCIERGVSRYDFLGGYSEHKRRWGGQHQTGYDLMFFSPARWFLQRFLKPVWPSGRFIKDLSKQLVSRA